MHNQLHTRVVLRELKMPALIRPAAACIPLYSMNFEFLEAIVAFSVLLLF